MNVTPPNRQQLAVIAGNDPVAIRFLEQLFQLAGSALPDAIAALQAILEDGDKGDITLSVGGATWTIDANSVGNGKLANMLANTVKTNPTSGVAGPVDLALGLSQLLGRGSAGNITGITLGGNMTMTGNVLDSIGGAGGGSPTLTWMGL